jgi:hypothetical protein
MEAYNSNPTKRRRMITSIVRAALDINKSSGATGETVRREKALDFSGCNSRPGTGSLHPAAIEAAVEATKLSEPSMERVV